MFTPSQPSRARLHRSVWFAALFVICALAPGARAQEQGAETAGSHAETPVAVPTPEGAFGFRIGEDGRLAGWSQILDYLERLGDASPRVRVEQIGRSVMGRSMVMAVITSPTNHERLEEIRRAQARIADPRGLTDADRRRLIRDQPAVVFIGASIHGTEMMGTQMTVELAHELATDPGHAETLEEVVVLLVPSMNPDGLEITRDWFLETRGTEHAEAPMPWLYHNYAGHDNNRDFYMITQPETRAVSDVLYRRWFPLLVWDIHEMGNGGERFFLPPFADPLNPNLDPLLVRLTNLVGVQMAADMTAAGLTGISHRERFDHWWHGGGRTVPARHNMIGILSEAASVRYADPVHQPASSLRQPERGSLYPEPWPGGWWRARDIVDYELVAARSLLGLMQRQRERFVRDKIELARRQVELGKQGYPFAYLVPPGQRDEAAAAELLQILRRGGVEVHEATEPVRTQGTDYPAGTRIVLMAQPYRAHAKDLLELQDYPHPTFVSAPTGTPYDLTGWTLPLQMGVSVHEVGNPFALPSLVRLDSVSIRPARVTGRGPAFVLDARNAHAHRAVFEVLRSGGAVSFTTAALGDSLDRFPARAPVVSGVADLPMRASRWASAWGVRSRAVARPIGPAARRLRVGVYRPWAAVADEGWTRWVFEQWGVPFETVRDSAIRAGRLNRRFDTIVIPSLRRTDLVGGPSGAHPRYAGGIGAQGAAAFRDFVEAGGTLVLLGASSEFALRELGLPVRDVTTVGEDASRWSAPGSLLRVEWNLDHPVAAGMPLEGAVFYAQGPVFAVDPGARGVRIIASYPEREILLSGSARGESVVAGQAAALEVELGAGRVILFGFRPQHRGQTHGSFGALFNALYPR